MHAAAARSLSEEESLAVVAGSCAGIRGRRLATRIMGWDGLRSDPAARDIARTRHFMALRPADTSLGPEVQATPAA
jgi:hypothetical protein